MPMVRRPCRTITGLGLVLLFGLTATADTGTDPQTGPPARPRVCLVLSGGGALGLAHVGVLQVLEELHVPVDCIAGTSMGAIVGGLYAAGYSADELASVSLGMDWRELLRDAPDRRDLPYRRKVDDLTYLTRWELGFSGGKLRMPSGLVPGQKLQVALRVLALRAAGIDDFDRLPVPFRAVAADIETGETVVLGRGDLAEALRASMAFPGLFSPVEVDGRLLVDGGVVANLPVETARAMGAEVVIAVDLGDPLSSLGRPESIAGILSRTSAFLTRLNVEKSLADVDILLHPSLGDLGLLDFHAAPEILSQGAAAARAQQDALRRLAVDDAEWRRVLDRQRRETPSLEIKAITIDPGPGLAPSAIARSVHSRPGRPLDVAVLQGDLKRLHDLGEFETVDFRLTRLADGWTLAITGHAKSWGPNYLRFGLGLASDLEGESRFNALAAYTMTRLNRVGAELKVASQVGESPLLSAELYQPLGPSRVPFVAAGLGGSQVKTQLLLDGESLQYRFVEQRATLDLGLALGRYGEVRLGARRDATTGRATQGQGDRPEYDRVDAGVHLDVTIDQIDSVNFPRNGLLAFARYYDALPDLGSDDDYRRLDIQTVSAGSVGRHSLVGLLTGTSALGGTLPPTERFYLGGLFNLSGLPPGEVSGSYGGVAALLYLYRLGRLPNFGEGIYLGASAEAGNAWEHSSDASLSDLRYSFALLVGADTFIGPVYLGQGFTSGGKDSFYLLVGRNF